jgi:protein-tyrosine-phosphatase
MGHRMTKPYLFVCVENSCRSQIAEAFARMIGVEAYSTGSKPSGVVNPKAIASMAEVGYDLSRHESSSHVPDCEFEAVIAMGCGDACPPVRTSRVIEWQIPDPKEMDSSAFARVRDRIREQVVQLIA